MKGSLVRNFIFILAAVLAGCFEAKKMDATSLENMVNKNLAEGDNSIVIEEFMEGQNWNYDYDPLGRRYQASIKDDEKKDARMQIYIYVNELKEFKFVEIEVIRSGIVE